MDRPADHLLVFDLVAGAEFVDPCPVAAGLYAPGEQRKGLFHVADQRNVGRDDLADLGGIDFEVDDLGVRPETARIARHAVVEAHAHGEEQVAVPVFDVGTVVAVHAQHADVLRRVGRQGRKPQQGRCGGHAALVEEGAQLRFAAAQDHALPDHDQRPLCGVDQPCRFGDALFGGYRCGDIAADRSHFLVAERGRSALGVLGDVHDHGAGAARTGDVERLGDGARNLFGALDLTVPFGDGLRDAHEIGLLKGVGAQQRRTDLSGYEHQRRGVHQRVGESRHGIGGAGAGGDQTDPHAAADAGVALRGVYGALFVPHEDVAQAVAVVVECVVDGDDRPAGVAENRIDALAQERFDQGLRSRDGGTGLRFGHVCLRRIHDCCCFTYSSSTMRTAPLPAELTSLA